MKRKIKAKRRAERTQANRVRWAPKIALRFFRETRKKNPNMSYRMLLTLAIAIFIITLSSFMQVSITGYHIASPPITIDGRFNDWTSILSNPDKVIYDGSWANMTDLDKPKQARDLVRFASTWDKNYIYFYFERADGHENVDTVVYIDANNNGLMEKGEPVVHFKWSKDSRRYSTYIGVYKYASESPVGDTMECGDGCTMPGKEKKIWRNIEKLWGASSDHKKLETRLAWKWLNISVSPECKSCGKIYSSTMQLSEPLAISQPTNASVYYGSKLIAKYPITPSNTTFTVTNISEPEINITVDGTSYCESIDTSCSQPIGQNMTFDEFDILNLNATQKQDCIAPPSGFNPRNLIFHISSSEGDIPSSVRDNMNKFKLRVINITCTDNDGDNYSIEGGDCGPADCNDANENIHPGAAEACNSIDDDCNGVIDNIAPRNCSVAHQGICAVGTETCTAGSWSGCPLPQAEACNGLDDDCDSGIDENLIRGCGTDVGACVAGIQTCTAGSWGICAGEIAPVNETCNGLDDDCDGIVDNRIPSCTCIDGQTQSCGTDIGECASGIQTCINGNWGSCVGETGPAIEICNNLDDDCDGGIDENVIRVCGTDIGECASGVEECTAGAWGGCSGIGPTAEVCDGKDNDCNGLIDDGIICECLNGQTQDCGTDVGACVSGTQTCAGGRWQECTGAVDPVEETCNNIDDDCDGIVDEDLIRICGTDVGECEFGVQTCLTGNWGICEDEIGPLPEVCNGADDDCDGLVDENFPNLNQSCSVSVGACRRTGIYVCTQNGSGTECNAVPGQPAEEVCNGIDDDCDGLVDEGLICVFCTAGTTLCNDGACSSNCSLAHGGNKLCIGQPNSICEFGEGCACQDCDSLQDTCSLGNLCVYSHALCYCSTCDSDNDGLTDYAEVHDYNTSPYELDSDHGGTPDGIEIEYGLNPLDPSDDKQVGDINVILIKPITNKFKAGDIITVAANVTNQEAEQMQGLNAIFTVDGVQKEVKFFNISGFETKSVEFTWIPSQNDTGDRILAVEVDNLIDLDPLDNKAQKIISILFPISDLISVDFLPYNGFEGLQNRYPTYVHDYPLFPSYQYNIIKLINKDNQTRNISVILKTSPPAGGNGNGINSFNLTNNGPVYYNVAANSTLKIYWPYTITFPNATGYYDLETFASVAGFASNVTDRETIEIYKLTSPGMSYDINPDDPDTLNVNDSAIFNVTISNLGNETAENLYLTLKLSSGLNTIELLIKYIGNVTNCSGAPWVCAPYIKYEAWNITAVSADYKQIKVTGICSNDPTGACNISGFAPDEPLLILHNNIVDPSFTNFVEFGATKGVINGSSILVYSNITNIGAKADNVRVNVSWTPSGSFVNNSVRTKIVNITEDSNQLVQFNLTPVYNPAGQNKHITIETGIHYAADPTQDQISTNPQIDILLGVPVLYIPDIIIGEILVNKGDTFNITISITNNGTVNASNITALAGFDPYYFSMLTINPVNYSSIAVNETINASFILEAMNTGTTKVNVTVTCDYDQKFKEKNITISSPALSPSGPSGGGNGGLGEGAEGLPITEAEINAALARATSPRSYYIGDFARKDVYTPSIGFNELWYFTYEDINHTVQLTRMTADSVDLMVMTEPIYLTLKVKETRQIDADRDGIKDVKLTLNSIADNRANITLKLPPKTPEIVKTVNANYMQFIFGLFCILLVVLFLFLKRRKEEEKEEK